MIYDSSTLKKIWLSEESARTEAVYDNFDSKICTAFAHYSNTGILHGPFSFWYPRLEEKWFDLGIHEHLDFVFRKRAG